ncbi:hypothetical protein ACJDU8_08905 [Clostridium sp. WILCCON 0269]|uniref:Uncharacterized protein n=1 Tax=Candidatus Clostridium eludens TaxID=3381663 RepID=A0ABW8SJA0_9CLOT
MKEVKTYQDWQGDINDYLQVGDLVDFQMVAFFLRALPITCENDIIQGRQSIKVYIDGKKEYVYPTLMQTKEGWEYAGNCLKGETKNIEI